VAQMVAEIGRLLGGWQKVTSGGKQQVAGPLFAI
jgi:hypothetical protein